MSFDISRSAFRPRSNFLGVVMQQGRVQLDSDWNEAQSQFSRRIQAGSLDAMGRAVYPASTPNAFKIAPGANAGGPTLFIGAGRYYVDGLLAENHGPESQATWDGALAEMSGAAFGAANAAQTDYARQPYLPNPAPPVAGHAYVAYLDVWLRDVTYLEHPGLIDPAVNIDTTGRVQTVWQVKLLDLGSPAQAPDCSTDIPAFDALFAPPAGRLTSGHVANAAAGPCCLAPNTGYTGLENQLYRVEIHTGGAPAAPPAGGYSGALPAGAPTFKWSRDNASVQNSVYAIATLNTASGSVSQLTVGSLGRDQVLGFAVNDWIEITDDVYELNNQAGEIYQIVKVVAAANAITLSGVVSGHFPLTSGQTDPKRRTRITRWDQSGKIYATDASGNLTLWYDLATSAAGVIPVPPANTTLVLESGVTAAFDLSPESSPANPTAFRVADHWLFAARAADGSVEALTSAPPLGVHHHYAKLGVVAFPATVADCRIPWPPASAGGGCCCTVTISPADLAGEVTLQSILDKYQNAPSPIAICLEAGTYALPAPLRLTSAHANIALKACQPGAVVLRAVRGQETQFNDGLIVLDNASSITLSGLSLSVPASRYSYPSFAGLVPAALPSAVRAMVQTLIVSVGVRIVGGENLSLCDCAVLLADSTEVQFNETTAVFAAGVFLNGEVDGVEVRRCSFRASNLKLFKTSEAKSMGCFVGVAMSSSVAFASVAQTPAVDAAKGDAKLETDALGLEQIGLQSVGGALQNIFNFGEATSASLAAGGGEALPAALDRAAFVGNSFADLTFAALLMGEVAALECANNQVDCVAGFWCLAASKAQTLLSDPRSLALVGATVALAMPPPQGDKSSLVAVPPASPSVYLYTGAAASGYKDSVGDTWLPDASVKSVTISAAAGTQDWLYEPKPPPAIAGTSDAPLYQSERAGPSFSYAFNGLAPGFYSVTLDFAEIVHTKASDSGVRVFDVTINNLPVLTNFDIDAAVGPLAAFSQTFADVPSANGQVVVQFSGTSAGSDHNAKVNALSLVSASSGASFLGAGNESDSALFFDQLVQVARQGYVSVNQPARWRFDANEMQGLAGAGVLLLDDDSLFNANSGSLLMTGNRIDGRMPADYLRELTVRDFRALVVVSGVSRAVVTSNLFVNQSDEQGVYGPSLLVAGDAAPQPMATVMSNLLAGAAWLPARNLNDAGLDAYAQTWAFLNTVW